MEHQGYLALVAEIAAAFAGFTGIVAVFRHGSDGWDDVETQNFVTMLRASLSALFLSLMPYVLSMLFSDPETVWRTASALVILVMGSNLYIFASRITKLNKSLGHMVLMPTGVVLICVNAAAVAGLLAFHTLITDDSSELVLLLVAGGCVLVGELTADLGDRLRKSCWREHTG